MGLNLRKNTFLSSAKAEAKKEALSGNIRAKLKSKNVCITGKVGSYTRQDVEDWLRYVKAYPVGAVRSTTDILIIGTRPGARKSRAANNVEKISGKDIVPLMKADNGKW